MKNSNLITGISLIVGLIITVFIFKLIQTSTNLKTFDIVLLLLFPIIIAIVTYLFSTNDLIKLKADLIEEYKNHRTEVNSYVDRNRFVCHGTKFGVPNRSEFWDHFLIYANNQFVLFGKTNHNWVSGGNEQSIRLGNAIVSILEKNGRVKILSQDKEETIVKHKVFIEKYVVDKIKKSSNKNALLKKFQDNFTYRIKSHLNFTAVISDDRIIILPRMNNDDNHEKCMVLELNHSMEEIYKNYSTDIETIFELAPEITFEL
jgi:hypothetical protein